LPIHAAIEHSTADAKPLTKYGKLEAAQFLRNLIAIVPYKIHTLLIDSGI
jgi:hypothetical protein